MSRLQNSLLARRELIGLYTPVTVFKFKHCVPCIHLKAVHTHIFQSDVHLDKMYLLNIRAATFACVNSYGS